MTAPGDAALRRALLAPASVALIGASDNPAKLTARPQSFLRQHGFAGRVYPVNPRRRTVLGERAWASVAELPEPVEHAYILLDAEPALAALAECAAAGVRVVSLLADGFAEAGAAGRARQQRLTEIAAGGGVHVLGPNSMGVVDTRARFACTVNAAFAAARLETGRLAVISQSGSVIGTLLSRGQARGLAFSSLVSVGNEAGLGVGEVGGLLADDPGSDAFALFLETLRRPEAIAAFARRAHALGKPVVAYLLGRSRAGQALSVSHTGALTGSDAAAAAFLREHGIARVEVFEALLESPAALARAPAAERRPRRATVVTTTGGGGAMVVDQLGARGLAVAGASTATRAALADAGIRLGGGTLVDVTLAGTNYATLKAVLSALLRDPDTGVVVAVIGSSAQFNPELAVRPLIDAHAELGADAAPVLAFPLPQADASLALLAAAGVPAFRSVESCAETAALLLEPPAPRPRPRARLPGRAAAALAGHAPGLLNEVEAGAVLRALGIATPAAVVLAPGQPPPARLPFAFPCAAKLVSADIPHKSDLGAVRLHLADRDALAAAVEEMTRALAAARPDARVEAVLVQAMHAGVAEVLVGLTRDPRVGAVVTVGIGGVLAELYADTAVCPAPVTAAGARALLAGLRGCALLAGYRGRPPADVDALARAVASFSRLALAPAVAEAEINPLCVGAAGEGVAALDALVRLAPAPA